MDVPQDRVQVTDDRMRSTFVLLVDGEARGRAFYRAVGRLVIVTYTEVQASHRGRGLAGQLASSVLEQVRTSGRRVVPVCPFLAGHVHRHPEYADLVAARSARPRR